MVTLWKQPWLSCFWLQWIIVWHSTSTQSDGSNATILAQRKAELLNPMKSGMMTIRIFGVWFHLQSECTQNQIQVRPRPLQLVWPCFLEQAARWPEVPQQCQLSRSNLKHFCSLRPLPDFLYLVCPFVIHVSCSAAVQLWVKTVWVVSVMLSV